jgi:hypothetical protein
MDQKKLYCKARKKTTHIKDSGHMKHNKMWEQGIPQDFQMKWKDCLVKTLKQKKMWVPFGHYSDVSSQYLEN